MVALLLTSMLALAFSIQPVEASGTIYIRADGSIDPPTANITSTDNVTYTFTDHNSACISVQRNNIVIDGADYTLQGSGIGTGVNLASRRNVTVKNMTIRFFDPGINMDRSEDNRIINNTIANSVHHSFGGLAISMFLSCRYNVISYNTIINNRDGIMLLEYCRYNTIANNFVNNTWGGQGITLYYSHQNKILNNVVMYSGYTGICLGGSFYVYGSSSNIISGNTVTSNSGSGIYVNARWGGTSMNNTIVGNNIAYNGYNGVSMGAGASQNKIIANEIKYNNLYGINVEASGNVIYHNNITNNEALVKTGYAATWDNGYPSGGNYWSAYSGTDAYSGPYQNETGSDGIGDSPYIIDVNNNDFYPLMTPYLRSHDVAILHVAPSTTFITQGEILGINVTIANQGDFFETFNVTVYLHGLEIEIDKKLVSILNENSKTIIYVWNTTGFDVGNYTLRVTADPVPGETDILDNQFIDGWVIITPALVHDIAIIEVEVSKNTVGLNTQSNINVTFTNQGNYSESFTVNVYANSSVIASTTFSEFASGVGMTHVFTWNTSGWVLGNYMIKAVAEPVPEETDLSDNTLVDGWIFLTISGDVDGDRDVDIFDIVAMAGAYGSHEGDPEYNPNYDIDGDGDVDIFDIVAACGNYGESW